MASPSPATCHRHDDVPMGRRTFGAPTMLGDSVEAMVFSCILCDRRELICFCGQRAVLPTESRPYTRCSTCGTVFTDRPGRDPNRAWRERTDALLAGQAREWERRAEKGGEA